MGKRKVRTEKEETRCFSHLRPRFSFQDSFTSMVGHNEDLLAQKDVSRPVLGAARFWPCPDAHLHEAAGAKGSMS